MPLQDLPAELFLEIVKNLYGVDKQCLRLACSGFRSLIPRDKLSWFNGYPNKRDSEYMPFLDERNHIERRELLGKLTGDATGPYRDRDVGGICVRCLLAKPASALSKLVVDGDRFCTDCLVRWASIMVPNGHSYGIGGEKTTYKCDCGTEIEEEDAVECKKLGERLKICLGCHFGECSDNDSCSGWPKFVRDNWNEIMGHNCKCADCLVICKDSTSSPIPTTHVCASVENPASCLLLYTQQARSSTAMLPNRLRKKRR